MSRNSSVGPVAGPGTTDDALVAILAGRRGVEDLAADEMAVLKRNGLYHQPHAGGFLVRVKVPGGLLQSAQLRMIAQIADSCAGGLLCLTTRQDIQLHRAQLADAATVLEAVASAHLTTMNACGDTTRNVVTCALQGVCPHEVADVRPLIEAISTDPRMRDERRTLPRKNKVSVAGCNRACGMTLINCQGWYPTPRPAADGGTEIGWRYYGGGGLGARPVLGRPVFDFVPFGLALDVTCAATEVFNRRGNRENRARARIKFLVQDMGVPAYGEEILGVLREWGVAGTEAIVAAQGPSDIAPAFVDGQTVIPQRQTGFCVVRVHVPRGELSSSQAADLAQMADDFGDGTVQLTDRQNLLFRFVPEGRAPALLDELGRRRYATEGFERATDIVACIGCRQCPHGQVDTVGAAEAIVKDLEQHAGLVANVGRVRIQINGCHNSCAHHWVGDIGLRGYTGQGNGQPQPSFVLHVGGSVQGQGAIARDVGRLAAGDAGREVRRLLADYVATRNRPDESFADYAQRTALAGESRKGA